MFETIQDRNTLKILTPGLKKRKTAKIKLNNGLKVYLVSDPDADKSAAGISMAVGAWQDPKNYPGLAHFCEHLLFMGTKTYPKENHFTSSVKDNGGIYNAYTAQDRTVYMFSANHKAFPAILDQYAHFFIDPAFNPSLVQRELHAVDQENDRNYENDFWRSWMVFKEMINPNHPHALFSTGNAQTLGNIPVAEVKKWYQNHYTPHKANLVLYSPCSIKELTQMAVRYFSNMSNQTMSSTSPYVGTMSSKTQRKHIAYIKSIKDIRILNLKWELPAAYASIDNKAADLVAYVINSKAPNSLYSQLKKENIAENIYSEVHRIGNVPFLYIDIVFVKNDQPLPIEQAIARCFQTLAGLRESSIPKYLFEEMRTHAKTSYNYQARSNAFGFVMDCAHQLVDESLDTYPLKTILPTTYQPRAYQKVLNLLSPSECIFTVLAPAEKTEVVYDRKEKWYGAHYCVASIPQHKLVCWEQIIKHPNIGIPPKNPFIPTNFTLKHKVTSTAVIPKPLLLENTAKGKAFFYADDRYEVPNIAWILKVKTPLVDGSPKQEVLMKLYIKSLEPLLANELTQASQAGLSCSFYLKGLEFCCTINGYSDKASLLLRTLLDKLKGHIPSKEKFQTYRASLALEYANTSKSQPIGHTLHMFFNLFTNYTPSYKACLNILNSISYMEFCDFSKTFFEKAYTEALFAGNLTKQEAANNWNIVKNIFESPYPKAEHHKPKILVLSKDSGPYKILKKITPQGHAACIVLQAGAFSFEKNAAMQILGKALQDAYFDTLRTKQQIAYVIHSFVYEKENQLMYIFAIQSSTHPPEELLARTESFIEDYVKDFITHLPEARFENLRKQLIISLKTPPPNLFGMSARLYGLIFEYDEDFEHINKQISALEKITYKQVKSYAADLASRQNHRRVACLVEGVALKGKDFKYQAVDSADLKKISSYVQKNKSVK